MYVSQIYTKNVTNCFATLSHVYRMYHVPYVSYITNVCVSNFPQKCDQLFCDFVSCVSYVSCAICIIYNKCMCSKICPKNVTNSFASLSHVYHTYHVPYVSCHNSVPK